MTRTTRTRAKRRAREWWLWRDTRRTDYELLIPSTWGEKKIPPKRFSKIVELIRVREVLQPKRRGGRGKK